MGMSSQFPENRFFKPPRESTIRDEEVCSRIRAEFYDVRTRFLDRLACAKVFDRELFVALLLWLDTLRRSCAAADIPMTESDFDSFSAIAQYLEQEATYSRDQRVECNAAQSEWHDIMRQYGQLPENKP